MDTPSLAAVDWPWAYRIIPSRFPPVNVFERYFDSAEDMEIAFALEAHTNPRLLDEAGDFPRVPPAERIWGVGASWVLAAFTHIGRPSRFSDGSYGIYYAAESIDTAIAETRFHRERFLRAAASPSVSLHLRVLRNRVVQPCHDLRPPAFASLLQPDLASWPAAQSFAAGYRAAGSWGFLYPSVRRPLGECAALFRPRALTLPSPEAHLEFFWDGSVQAITAVRPLP